VSEHFSKGYEEFHGLAHRMIVAKTDLGEDSTTRILATLRKFGAMDMLSEFMENVGTTDNRVYNAGYLDALDDLMRFIKHGKKD
jgi:hypothetical protein